MTIVPLVFIDTWPNCYFPWIVLPTTMLTYEASALEILFSMKPFWNRKLIKKIPCILYWIIELDHTSNQKVCIIINLPTHWFILIMSWRNHDLFTGSFLAGKRHQLLAKKIMDFSVFCYIVLKYKSSFSSKLSNLSYYKPVKSVAMEMQVQFKFLKSIPNLKKSTPNWIVYGQTVVDTLRIYLILV